MLAIIKRLVIVSMLLIASRDSLASQNALRNVKITQEVDSVRITCDLQHKCHFRCIKLDNPDRLVIELKNVAMQTKLSPPKTWLLPVISHIRSVKQKNNTTQLVFELKQSRKYKQASSTQKNQYLLIVDLLNPSEKNTTVVTTANDIEALSQPEITTKHASKLANLALEIAKNGKQSTDDGIMLEAPTPLNLSMNLPLQTKPKLELQKKIKSKNIVVVIDPGHGGKDPGATGVNGTREKDVVLRISKLLQQSINEEPGYCAVLTRTTDYYIPLRKRLAIARKNHADMFVAVHADAYHHGHATGASVYALSQRGATSEAARWLAEKENESELGGLSSELADKDAILRSVLIDLSQTHTIEASLQIGEAVLHQLGHFTPLHHSRVEQAAFVVLKSPDIPSILVETGFLSNPHEENKLTDISFQRQTAFALKQGIIHYFELNPPTGALFGKGDG